MFVTDQLKFKLSSSKAESLKIVDKARLHDDNPFDFLRIIFGKVLNYFGI